VSDFDYRARKAADAVRQQIAANPISTEKGIRRAQRSLARGALIPSAVAAAVFLVAGVVVAVPHGRDNGTPSAADGAAFAVTGALKPFSTCDAVLQYFQDQAPEYLIQRAAGGNVAIASGEAGGAAKRTAVPQQGRASDSSASGAEPANPDSAHSTTNVQEAGVDEPDIVKTDGKRIVAVAQSRFCLGNVCSSSAVKRPGIRSLGRLGQASRRSSRCMTSPTSAIQSSLPD
jgi:hypothetical protein